MVDKTREEKYQKLRTEISQMDKDYDNPYNSLKEPQEVAMNDEELKTEHIKKNTLSISIDQLIKAHDEYTVMISKEEIDAKEVLAKKEADQKRKKLIQKYLVMGIAILLAIICLAIIIIALIG